MEKIKYKLEIEKEGFCDVGNKKKNLYYRGYSGRGQDIIKRE